MRICLINPPNIVIPHDLPTTQIYQPLGIAYVAAMLERHGHEVHVLDALALGWKRNTGMPGGRRLVGLPPQEITEGDEAPAHQRSSAEAFSVNDSQPLRRCVSSQLACVGGEPNDS